MTDRTDTPGAISAEDAKIPQRIAAQYFRERDRTDTDTLPPPDGLIHGDVNGYYANMGNGYTVATVRRLLAERDERIARLEEALSAAKPWLDAMLSRPPQTPEMVELLARVEATLAKGNT